MDKLQNNLIWLKKKSGHTQEDLADMLNISRQSISKWERGEASPDLSNMIELARIYSVTIDELLGSDLSVEKCVEVIKMEDCARCARANININQVVCVYHGIVDKNCIDEAKREKCSVMSMTLTRENPNLHDSPLGFITVSCLAHDLGELHNIIDWAKVEDKYIQLYNSKGVSHKVTCDGTIVLDTWLPKMRIGKVKRLYTKEISRCMREYADKK